MALSTGRFLQGSVIRQLQAAAGSTGLLNGLIAHQSRQASSHAENTNTFIKEVRFPKLRPRLEIPPSHSGMFLVNFLYSRVVLTTTSAS